MVTFLRMQEWFRKKILRNPLCSAQWCSLKDPRLCRDWNDGPRANVDFICIEIYAHIKLLKKWVYKCQEHIIQVTGAVNISTEQRRRRGPSHRTSLSSTASVACVILTLATVTWTSNRWTLRTLFFLSLSLLCQDVMFDPSSVTASLWNVLAACFVRDVLFTVCVFVLINCMCINYWS